MTKVEVNSIRIAQIDDKIKKKLKFRFRLQSPISLLISELDMPDMLWFSFGGIENQHDAILESFSLNEQTINSFTRSPSTT